MTMAKDGRFRKPGPTDWPQVLRRRLPAEVWRSFHGRVQQRGDPRTHWVPKYIILCWAFMGWICRPGLVERFAESRAALVGLHPSRRRPGGSLPGLVKAGQRLTAAAFHTFWVCLREEFAGRLGAGWRWCGWVVFGVDGSRVKAPRGAAQAAA